MLKILVIDDEKKIVDVLTSYLEKEGYEVFSANNGSDALELFYKKGADVIITDLMLPDLSGEELCLEVRKISDVPIIMLTAKSGEANIIKGLELGADDYIIKPFSPREVCARVKSIVRRNFVKFTDIVTFNNGEFVLNRLQKTLIIRNEEVLLTHAEYRILEVMTSKPNKVFSRDELLNIVAGNNITSFDRTIDAHIKNIRSKIEKNKKEPEYIITAFGIGYKFGGVPSENH